MQSKRNISSTGHIKYLFYKKPSIGCLIEKLKLCLYNNNSLFADENLLQTNGTAFGETNPCSYAHIAVTSLDQTIME